ncbi:hypothetical protein [Thermogladius sp.]|uniref:hypothetical protein n=1 Tax=Thermogladius sp. TaxID=2023064 RepID=UPI003D0FEF39
MDDTLPEELRLKMLKRLISAQSQKKEERDAQPVDPERAVYSKLSDDRALELVEKTKQLYPREYPAVVSVLYEMLKRGIVDKLDGLTVLAVLRRLGLDVRPELRIKFVKQGREVDFEDYVK